MVNTRKRNNNKPAPFKCKAKKQSKDNGGRKMKTNGAVEATKEGKQDLHGQMRTNNDAHRTNNDDMKDTNTKDTNTMIIDNQKDNLGLKDIDNKGITKDDEAEGWSFSGDEIETGIKLFVSFILFCLNRTFPSE